MPWSDIILRIGLAIAAGLAVGINRDLFGKPTGLRLHALVATGSAVAVLCGLESDTGVGASRVIQGIVGGIGFLGAGVIMHGAMTGSTSLESGARPRFQGLGVHNMTTAASIWLTSTLGIAAGLGLWRLLVAATVAAVVILLLGLPLDRTLYGRFSEGRDGDPIE